MSRANDIVEESLVHKLWKMSQIAFRTSDVNSPMDVNLPLFGFCQFHSTNMENMS